jgi:hypothetical protein
MLFGLALQYSSYFAKYGRKVIDPISFCDGDAVVPSSLNNDLHNFRAMHPATDFSLSAGDYTGAYWYYSCLNLRLCIENIQSSTQHLLVSTFS